MSHSESEILQQLLDAVDGGSGERAGPLAGRPSEGHFFGALEAAGLDDLEAALVLVALAARLEGLATLSGRDLVARVAPDSARRLAALGRLTPGGRLVQSGLLVPEMAQGGPAEAHAGSWRLGDAVFVRACEVFARPSETGQGSRTSGAYRNNAELLADLRRLSLVYRRRAARIFHLDPWTGTGIETSDGPDELVAQAQDLTTRVAERMAVTDGGERIPLLRFRDEHNLDLDALVILVTVLFQELVEGVGAVDAVDLVKLVSESEADLVRRRRLLRPLVTKQLLRLEGAYGDKELTADASLPNEVIAGMLGDDVGIPSDEAIDFHAYLQDLQSSDSFFLDLDGRPD